MRILAPEHSDDPVMRRRRLLFGCGGLGSANVGPKPLRKMIESYLDFADVDLRTRVADEGRPGLDGLIEVHELSGDGPVYEDENVSISTCLGAPEGLRSHLVNSHTSTADVGRIARTAGVGMLVLTHLAPTDKGPSAEVWTQEAKRDFGGEVVLGDDLMEL